MSGINRSAVSLELEAIYKQHGELTPELVVAEASANHNSALHGEFEWNPQKVHHAYLLERAREVIKVYYTVTLVPSTTQSVHVPTWQSEVHDDGTRSYAPITAIISDAARLDRLAIEAMERAESNLRNCPHKATQRLAKVVAKEIRRLRK